jgi:hypothetical protein
LRSMSIDPHPEERRLRRVAKDEARDGPLEYWPGKLDTGFPRHKRGTRLRGDHAQTKTESGMTIRRKVIAL